MAYTYDQNSNDIVISGFENGIAQSPYTGIANIQNLNTTYYPQVAYVNYRRQAASLGTTNVIDTYSESNFSAAFKLYSGASQTYVGQPFYNNAADNLASLEFFISKSGTPTGNITASVFPATINSSGQYMPTNNQFTVSALTVGGGGGGGNGSGGSPDTGGGGGGQVVSSSSLTVQSEAYTITVGVGGTHGNSSLPGGSSSFGSLLTATGGSTVSSNSSTGATSGSGETGGSGGSNSGGGGGGDSAGGSNGTTNTGGAGGAGTANSITGSLVTYGGGGGGSGITTGGAGGTGGGGTGGNSGNTGTSGTGNTGGGGGGSHNTNGGDGGTGVVIIAYPTGSLTATGGTITTSGGNTIHTFTTSGTWTVMSAPTPLATSNNVDISTLTGTNSLVTFTFGTPPALTAKTFYIATITYSGGDSSDYLNVGYGITQEYANNVSIYSTNGTVWTVQGTPAISQLIYYAISSTAITMGVPVQHAQSPAGLNYVLDTNGNIWKQTAVNSSAFNLLSNGPARLGNGAGGIAYWNNYLVVLGDGLIEFCGKGTNDSAITSQNWNSNNALINQYTSKPTLTEYEVGTISPPTTTIYIIGFSGFSLTAGQQVIFEVDPTYSLPAPLVVGTIYYALTTVTGNSPFSISATPGGSAITFTTAGTAGHTSMSILPMALPNGNITNLQFTVQIVPDSTSATINTYTLPNGTAANGVWLLASGNYNIIDPLGNNILATFANGSPTVNFISPTVDFIFLQNLTVQILNPSVVNYRPYISKTDGNLYFSNGRYVGRILSENTNISFDPSNSNSYVLDYAAFSVLNPSDTVVDMVDLRSTLIVAGQNSLYSWDYVSASVLPISPIGEPVDRITNLLNNIYILAGQKGNIYFSNGYSVQLLTKLSDYISGVFDPVWSFGGIMVHRSRLYFQALASTTAGTNLLAGTFSLQVAPSLLGETASGLIMEGQNSYGLVPPAGSLPAAILIDNEPSASGQDSYYSVWSNGATSGGIDFNDTTLWQNWEPTIETDIIPVGTILNKKTGGQIQFKLDRPMASGDEIRMYWRPSLTDSYRLMGTTTTNVLSDYYPSNVFQSQWAQFKIQFKAAASGSSFIPLKEIRIQLE